ncbi:MAG: Asp23/Gls24 family envelope stress response protein [Eubacterium sp.]|nr:Asp23/Gls24 family envelope stress response protein [Eubacterium sp.]
MAEIRKAYLIKEDSMGEVQISADVLASIAAIAATDVEGVNSIAGGLTREALGKSGIKSSSKGAMAELDNNNISVNMALTLDYDVAIPTVVPNVQNKVKTTLESMTGLVVTNVNVNIIGVEDEA